MTMVKITARKARIQWIKLELNMDSSFIDMNLAM
jgi:hypothetical protein